MRKIIAGMFITLDGVVEAPEQWNPPYYDEELSQAVSRELAAGDVAAALAELKRQPDKDIAVGASGTLVRFLLSVALRYAPAG
jgi:hypothetical protein